MAKGSQLMTEVGGFRLPAEIVDLIEADADGHPPYLELYRAAYRTGYYDNVGTFVAKLWEEFYSELCFDEGGCTRDDEGIVG